MINYFKKKIKYLKLAKFYDGDANFKLKLNEIFLIIFWFIGDVSHVDLDRQWRRARVPHLFYSLIIFIINFFYSYEIDYLIKTVISKIGAGSS